MGHSSSTALCFVCWPLLLLSLPLLVLFFLLSLLSVFFLAKHFFQGACAGVLSKFVFKCFEKGSKEHFFMDVRCAQTKKPTKVN